METEEPKRMEVHEVIWTQKTSVLEAKGKDKLVFWGHPLCDKSRFYVQKFTVELHPTLRVAEEADMDEIGMILDGKSTLNINGMDYWNGATSRFLKYLIGVREGKVVNLVNREGSDIKLMDWEGKPIEGKLMDQNGRHIRQELVITGETSATFTMDFKGRLREDSPWSIRVCLIGKEQRPIYFDVKENSPLVQVSLNVQLK